MCLTLFENSEGMELPCEMISRHTFPQRNTLVKLVENHKEELLQSKVYIAVTVHNQIPFIPNLRRTLEANVTELTQYGVQSHVIITCDGIQKDFAECNKQFTNFPLPAENIQILFNERDESVYDAGRDLFENALESEEAKSVDFSRIDLNMLKRYFESCASFSLTRWKQLNYIHELMKEDKQNNLSSYFFLFDGDDIIHKDLLLLELLAILEIGADAVSPGSYSNIFDSDFFKETASSGNIVRCRYEDSSEILERASRDVNECWIAVATHLEEFAFSLFDGRVLKKVLQEGYKFGFGENARSINPKQDFGTLAPLENAVTRVISVFLQDVSAGQKYPIPREYYDLLTAPFFDKQNEPNALFYYMQHDDSLEGCKREAKRLQKLWAKTKTIR